MRDATPVSYSRHTHTSVRTSDHVLTISRGTERHLAEGTYYTLWKSLTSLIMANCWESMNLLVFGRNGFFWRSLWTTREKVALPRWKLNSISFTIDPVQLFFFKYAHVRVTSTPWKDELTDDVSYRFSNELYLFGGDWCSNEAAF